MKSGANAATGSNPPTTTPQRTSGGNPSEGVELIHEAPCPRHHTRKHKNTVRNIPDRQYNFMQLRKTQIKTERPFNEVQ